MLPREQQEKRQIKQTQKNRNEKKIYKRAQHTQTNEKESKEREKASINNHKKPLSLCRRVSSIHQEHSTPQHQLASITIRYESVRVSIIATSLHRFFAVCL
jgi:hypothetical protein